MFIHAHFIQQRWAYLDVHLCWTSLSMILFVSACVCVWDMCVCRCNYLFTDFNCLCMCVMWQKYDARHCNATWCCIAMNVCKPYVCLVACVSVKVVRSNDRYHVYKWQLIKSDAAWIVFHPKPTLITQDTVVGGRTRTTEQKVGWELQVVLLLGIYGFINVSPRRNKYWHGWTVAMGGPKLNQPLRVFQAPSLKVLPMLVTQMHRGNASLHSPRMCLYKSLVGFCI